MKFLNIIQKVFKIARVLTVIAICLFFIAAGYELILVAIELLTHGSKAIDKHLIAHALEHLVHFVANGILLVFVFKYIKHEIHDGTPYTEEGAKELKEIGIVHPIITAAIIAIMDVALGQKFPSFFTGSIVHAVKSMPIPIMSLGSTPLCLIISGIVVLKTSR